MSEETFEHQWIKRVYENFKAMEEHEIAIHHVDRELAFAEFLVKALANPECEGSEKMLNSITNRRQKLKVCQDCGLQDDTVRRRFGGQIQCYHCYKEKSEFENGR
jgi:hypothetical protein